MVLSPHFYRREDVLQIAQDLLGKHLCTSFDGQLTSGMIVETVAYRAPEDKASHAYNNKRTNRTETMFLEGGVCYVYLCYGIHHLFNVVTGKKDQAHAVLIRAIEPIDGVDIMLKRRKMKGIATRLTAGPGCLSQALAINRANNGSPLTKSSTIWIEERNSTSAEPVSIIKSPRIGVDYAEECANWEWRFTIDGNPWCSK